MVRPEHRGGPLLRQPAGQISAVCRAGDVQSASRPHVPPTREGGQHGGVQLAGDGDRPVGHRAQHRDAARLLKRRGIQQKA